MMGLGSGYFSCPYYVVESKGIPASADSTSADRYDNPRRSDENIRLAKGQT